MIGTGGGPLLGLRSYFLCNAVLIVLGFFFWRRPRRAQPAEAGR